MKLNIKLYFQYLYSEMLLAVLSSAMIIFLTYWLDGDNGVIKIFDSANEMFEFSWMLALGTLFLISLILLVITHLFNLKHKFVIRKTAHGLYDFGLSLLRIGGGYLVVFPLLYLFVEGYITKLLGFFLVGFIALAESAFFSWFRDSTEACPQRPIQERK